MLNNRELAILIWLGVALLLVLRGREGRSNLAGILRQLGRPALAVPLLALLAWIVGVVWVADAVGGWQPALLGDTVASGVAALILLFSFDRAVKEQRFARRVAIDAIKVGAFAEAFVNLRTFSLPVELVVQPSIVVLILTSAVAATDPAHHMVKTFIDRLLALAGVVLFGTVAASIAQGWRELDRADALSFALPVWITLGTLPMLYVIWLYAAYDRVFRSITFTAAGAERPDGRTQLRTGIALVLALRGSVRDVGSFPPVAVWRVRAAPDVRAARRTARAVLEERRVREEIVSSSG